MTPAFAYLRVSGKGQVDGDGFERQQIACEKYASTHDLQIVETFREEGISGTTELENRPALQELLGALEENGTKTVIIEKLDRLARDLMVSESILADFQKRGITVISVMEPDLCSSEPTRILMRQMMAAFAQYEKSMIVLKLRGARQRMKSKVGRCEGKKPFGHTPQESLTLALMRGLKADGYTCEQICSALASRGISSRSGGTWHPSTIAKILSRAA